LRITLLTLYASSQHQGEKDLKVPADFSSASATVKFDENGAGDDDLDGDDDDDAPMMPSAKSSRRKTSTSNMDLASDLEQGDVHFFIALLFSSLLNKTALDGICPT